MVNFPGGIENDSSIHDLDICLWLSVSRAQFIYVQSLYNISSNDKESSMELDKILYKEISLRNFYNYTIKFPTEEKYIQRDYFVVDFPGGIIIM